MTMFGCHKSQSYKQYRVSSAKEASEWITRDPRFNLHLRYLLLLKLFSLPYASLYCQHCQFGVITEKLYYHKFISVFEVCITNHQTAINLKKRSRHGNSIVLDLLLTYVFNSQQLTYM